MARSSSGRPLGRAFFDRPTTRVARELLGAVLTVRAGGDVRSVELVEVEAYLAHDPASHAYRGPTRRNRSMFGPPGTLYVFRIHQVVCANLVTRPGEAVLLRAARPRRPAHANPSGPGRLCRVLGLTIADDGQRVGPRGRLSVTAPRPRPRPDLVLRSPRVGISRAVDRPLRFSLAGDRWVSRPRPRAT
ncbi:MAG TPA: DNA-3-methyladenine glycosylase [Thermoplasmata archaeon]|nr:DNA-3-methyladenine glycosylase [Thermoplasmata archaeon]